MRSVASFGLLAVLSLELFSLFVSGTIRLNIAYFLKILQLISTLKSVAHILTTIMMNKNHATICNLAGSIGLLHTLSRNEAV